MWKTLSTSVDKNPDLPKTYFFTQNYFGAATPRFYWLYTYFSLKNNQISRCEKYVPKKSPIPA